MFTTCTCSDSFDVARSSGLGMISLSALRYFRYTLFMQGLA